MKVVTLFAATACLLLSFSASVFAEPWYVPMGAQITGGFDHIQTLMSLPNSFADPAIDNFWAYQAPDEVDALALDWVKGYRNPIWAAADGPSIGDYALIFDLWLPSQPPVGTIIHFQAYLGSTRVDNTDLRYDGPTHNEWIPLEGTWNLIKPLSEPQWIPGDTDLDDDVDFADYLHLQVGYGVGDTWFEGDFNGNGMTDFGDYEKLQVNYGLTFYDPVYSPGSLNLDSSVLTLGNPEPATLVLVGLGAGLLLRLKRKKT